MDAATPQTDWLLHTARTNPRSIAVIDDDGAEFTYAQLSSMADEAVDAFSTTGALPGQVAMVPVSDLGAPCIARLWGAWRYGLAPLVIDENSPARDQWGEQLRELPAEVDPKSAAALHTVILTSGSGGIPRAVRLTHGNVAAAVAASSARLGNDAADRWLLTLPLFHIGGLSILWRSAAAGGAVVVHRRFEAARVAAAVRKRQITIASFVPTMLYRMLDVDSGPYPRIRAILLGGAAASRELVERALESGLPILQTYGMTEACSQVTTVVPGEETVSLGTAGRPIAGMEIATGGAGVGEIVVAGPAVSPGYLGEPDREGGHPTGDIGYLDENGRLVVLGRADDMVITGGENVYPSQVAAVLAGHPEVEQIEVVGVPDREWGQALVGVVAGPSGAQASIEQWAQQHLPRHQVPKLWAFVDEMPRLAGGKVDRTAVQAIAGKAR